MLRQELANFLETYPDVPEDITNKIKGICEETYSDTTSLKADIFAEHNQTAWALELIPILLSLEGNEAFSVLQLKQKKKG